MPKLKTVKGVKRRFKVTASGKLVRFRAGKRHLLRGKRAKAKRQMRRPQVLAKLEAKRIRGLIPYS